MPSPFPGMDPYLEANGVWPGFHHKFASELSTELNSILPAPYYADLEMREEMGILEEDGARSWIVPDVTIVRHSHPPQEPSGGSTAVLTRNQREISKWIEFEVHADPIRHHFVEIRDSLRGHKLITLIEILSPSNKRAGPDREAYESTQRQVLESDASLIELDLLRGGRRILPTAELEAHIRSLIPAPSYLVLVNWSWRRARGPAAYQGFPVGLREWLPCIPVPLKQGEDDVRLDLQVVFNRAYDTVPIDGERSTTRPAAAACAGRRRRRLGRRADPPRASPHQGEQPPLDRGFSRQETCGLAHGGGWRTAPNQRPIFPSGVRDNAFTVSGHGSLSGSTGYLARPSRCLGGRDPERAQPGFAQPLLRPPRDAPGSGDRRRGRDSATNRP